MAEVRVAFAPANDNRDAHGHGAALIRAGQSLIAQADRPDDVMERAGRKLLRRGLEMLEARA